MLWIPWGRVRLKAARSSDDGVDQSGNGLPARTRAPDRPSCRRKLRIAFPLSGRRRDGDRHIDGGIIDKVLMKR